jgi:hypothetical protein
VERKNKEGSGKQIYRGKNTKENKLTWVMKERKENAAQAGRL